MTAWKHLIAGCFHYILALLFAAYILKCFMRGKGRFSHLFPTIPALSRLLKVFELFTSFPQMIRLCSAIGTKYFLALITPHSKLAHMFGCLPKNINISKITSISFAPFHPSTCSQGHLSPQTFHFHNCTAHSHLPLLISASQLQSFQTVSSNSH